MKENEVLARQIKINGRFCKVTEWVSGWHPDKGKLAKGWTGKETMISYTGIIPSGVFTVKEGEQNERTSPSGRGAHPRRS